MQIELLVRRVSEPTQLRGAGAEAECGTDDTTMKLWL
jgi:hypothetical protein